jgi:hypothetical protein
MRLYIIKDTTIVRERERELHTQEKFNLLRFTRPVQFIYEGKGKSHPRRGYERRPHGEWS